MNSSSPLPVRRITFYKHGVAMVEREGRVQGDSLRLAFRDEDLDDALKSLTVLDRSGGQVACIDYDIPAGARSEANPLSLRAGTGMLDLMESLVGCQVRAELAGRGEPVEGRIAGLQYAKERRRLKGATLMLADEAGGGVRALPAAEVARLVPLDARAGQDLGRFLDAGRRAGGMQAVSLRLAPGEHDLAVSCLVPAPAWRVSYRVIAESHCGGPEPKATAPTCGVRPSATTDTGRLILQGWGLVDNRFDEDLQNVEISLVAGQPISFVYDLKTSRIPARRKVEDAARGAAGPVEYGALAAACFDADLEPEEGAGRVMMSCDSEPPRAGGRLPAALRSERAARLASIPELEAAAPASRTADQRETFAYEVLRPVSIPRGASALVPVLQATLDYRRELLFNEDKHPDHPVAALRCVNRSGLVLERGPATLVEDGRYRGEAIVPFTGRDGSLYLPYAVELGISVRVDDERSAETQRVWLADGLLHEEIATIRRFGYEIVNRTGEPRTVTIERDADSLPGELFDTPQPASRGEGVLRWDVACPAGGTTRFGVSARRVIARHQALADLRYDAIARWLADEGLAAGTRRALEALRDELSAIQENDRRIRQLGEQREKLIARQEHLRRNIGALSSNGDEGEVRLRMVRELQAADGQLSGIDRLVAELQAENERRRAGLGARLAPVKAV
ncbi:DUF4139 domain-containing protein [Burkholderiaceae bacterium FT117]|uniref:hypothetical protein n=1 Tax=Zeimonas sediminis TaxID=2944268 RepID=UPI0023431D06|nr:hypothetical protein [Zeimonas sediminis]MCM5571118.1 DUF4139 domain-containing protein [Zeimonas sediminis]